MDRLISEEAVLETIATWIKSSEPYDRKGWYLYDRVKAIPSAEPSEDAISRQAIKHKLQEHHDFFVNAYGGFSNLPQNDKSRVDEILNCIAMVVNEPSVKLQEPKTGHWIGMWTEKQIHTKDGIVSESVKCSECDEWLTASDEYDCYGRYCPNCGARMESEDKE